MFCPSDVNTGFIQLVGPIQQQDLNSITVNSYPLSISFAPRTTIPSLVGNRIDESTENTCTYKGKRFSLVDSQICSVINKGYTLPGMTAAPVAELILSFSANSSAADLSALSGILMCIPIYDSGTQSHSEYLDQIIDPSIPSCKYTNVVGSDYAGADYRSESNSSLTKCIKSCCGDPNCLAYTFNSGTCHLKNSIPSLTKTGNNNVITGTVDHNSANKGTSCPIQNCPVPKCDGKHAKGSNIGKMNDNKAAVPTLESIFYGWDGDTSQSSIAYKTCFETIDSNNTPNSRSLYIVIFPNGIHLTSQKYQQLLIQLNAKLSTYTITPAIRGGDSTLRSYKFNNEGNKVVTDTSQDGIIYATPISSCTDDFKHRFEYFTVPPRLPSSVSARYNSEQCPYYKTTQYKCMPFNQLKDLSGEYVIPGNKTLDTLLYEQQQQQSNAIDTSVKQSLSTEQIETIVAGVAGVAIASIILLKVGSWISNHA